MNAFIKPRIADLLLCTLLTTCLTLAVRSGFYLAEPYESSILLLVAGGLILQLLLFLLSYNRKTVAAGIILFLGLFIYAIRYAAANDPLGDETKNSIYIFCLILIISGILVMLLSRTRLGLLFLFIAGNLLIAGAIFLQFPVSAWASLLFVFGCAALYLYRFYLHSVKAIRLGKVQPIRYACQTGAACLIALMLATGLYEGIIRPLNPPTQELLLTQKLKSMNLLHVLGVAAIREVTDPNLVATEQPDQTLYDRDEEEAPTGEESKEEGTMEESTQENPETGDEVTDEEQDLRDANAIWYQLIPKSMLLRIILGLILAAVAAFASRILIRKRWHTTVQGLSGAEQVINYYGLFYQGMRSTGIAREEIRTLREYADTMGSAMDTWTTNGVSFQELIPIYERVIYGGPDSQEVSDQELALFNSYYAGFYKTLRKRAGILKYYLCIWRY